MRSLRPARVLITAGVAATLGIPLLAAPSSARPPVPVLLNLAQIARQDVPTFPGSAGSSASEADTLVEPDVAVSPRDPGIAVAAAHDSRFADGGAVGITHAWTRNGGASWNHAPVLGLTKAAGGAWDRASDPVLAFGPDGDVYLSVIAFPAAATDCRSVVLVSRSTDGGATFAAPSTAQSTNDCTLFNDKNWITVDDGPYSPHRGRVYQVWSFFKAASVDQTLRWSDDHGRTWSNAVQMTPISAAGTQNSQLVVQRDGTLVDTYLDYTFAAGRPDNERTEASAAARTRAAAPAASPGLRLMAIRSTDGGATWSAPAVVAEHVGVGPDDVRCCLPSGTIDPVAGTLLVGYLSEDNASILIGASSNGGRTWSPSVAARGTAGDVQRVNVDVAAYAGKVTVSYATRDPKAAAGRYWRQQVSTSYDRGASFGPPFSLGPVYDSRYGAVAGAVFPGDYIGTAAAKDRTYLVWAEASPPPDPKATYHQVLLGAAIRP